MNKWLPEILICPLTGSGLACEALEYSGEEVEFGVLTGDGGEYPIVAGIPILKSGQSEVVALLRAGRFEVATAIACAMVKYTPVLSHVMQSTRPLRRLRRFSRAVESRLRYKWFAGVARDLSEALCSGTAEQLLRLYYRSWGSDSIEAYYYNLCRFGMPGQFVAQAYCHSLPPQQGLILDHSCGAGHLTWGLIEAVAPAQVVGQDISFFSLVIARHFTARKGWFICSDIGKLPFRDGVFTTVFNSDAFTNFSAKLGAFEEMSRCSKDDATILLVWLRNRNRDHLYPNRPLTPEAYRRIVSRYRHRMIPDRQTLDRFLHGMGVCAVEAIDPELIKDALTLSLWIEKGDQPFPQGPILPEPVVPLQVPRVNPIYRLDGRNGQREQYVLRFPTDFYAQEDREMKEYYLPSFELDADQRAALNSGVGLGGVRHLVRRGAIVGMPERYM